MHQQGFVERVAGDADAQKGKFGLDAFLTARQSKPRDGVSAKYIHVEFNVAQIGLRFGTQEFAANLVRWSGLALDDRHVVACRREHASRGGPRQSATRDQEPRRHFSLATA